jgi:hypothetical protein
VVRGADLTFVGSAGADDHGCVTTYVALTVTPLKQRRPDPLTGWLVKVMLDPEVEPVEVPLRVPL